MRKRLILTVGFNLVNGVCLYLPYYFIRMFSKITFETCYIFAVKPSYFRILKWVFVVFKY